MQRSEDAASTASLHIHLLRFWKPLIVGLILGIISVILALIQPFLAGQLIQRVEHSEPVLSQLAMVIAISTVSALIIGFQQLILGALTERSTASWRRWFIKSFFNLPLLGRTRHTEGWFSSRLITDPPLVGRFVGSVLVQSIQSALMMVGSLLVLIALDPVSVSIPVAFAGLSLAVALGAARPAGRRRAAIQNENSKMSDGIGRAVSAARLVIALNADPLERQHLERAIQESRAQGTKLNVVYSLLGPITVTLMQMAYASVFVVGGWRVASGKLSFSELITFLMVFNTFQSSIQEVSALPGGFSECKAALAHFTEVRRIADSAKGKSSRHEHLTAVIPQRVEASLTIGGSEAELSPAVQFSDVSFAYPGETVCLLDRVSFTVPRKSLTVIVGASGCGKSTALGLVEGFFYADSGSVTVLGRNVSKSTSKIIREQVGYVDQDSSLLGASVRESLQFGGREKVDPSNLQRTLERVGLWDQLVSGGGLDAPVGNGGLALSGGQKQRLSIARALLQNPELLVLDEPTSSLDGFAEERIRRVLREVSSECTVLLTAHRLSTILEADWIVVLHEGNVIGEGTHADLLRDCPFYRTLVEVQLRPVNEVPAR